MNSRNDFPASDSSSRLTEKDQESTPGSSAQCAPSSEFDLSNAAKSVSEFVRARDWGQFHSLKNLTMALSGEVGELAAILQWRSDVEVHELLETELGRARVEEEVADIAIYLLRIAQQAAIDLAGAINRKVAVNETRYPVARSKGTAKKYTELDS